MTRPPGDESQQEAFPDLESLMQLVDRSAYRDLIADVPGRRRRVFEALANSEDPVWREIGEQLRDGRMQPSDVLQSEFYWNKVRQGLTENQDDFRRAVLEAKEQLERAEAEREEGDR